MLASSSSSSSSARLLASAALITLLVSQSSALPCGDACTEHQASQAYPSVSAAGGIADGTHQQTCTPNFQGAPVLISLASDANEDQSSEERWCIPSEKEPLPGAVLEVANASMTTFRLEQTGQPENAFIIKLGNVGNNSLILAPNDNGEVALCDISKASSAKFMVTCEECQQPDGSRPKAKSVVGRSCTFKDASGRSLSEADGKVSLQQSSEQQSGQQQQHHRYFKRCGDEGGCYSGDKEDKDENEPALFDIVVADGDDW